MKNSAREMIKSQIEKSTEKLNAARTLCREGFIDDAISRAYYSMFHATSAVLLSEEITVDSHSALKTMFGLYFIKTGKIKKEYGRWLNRLKDDRENGDYDIFTGFEEDDAKEAIKNALKFLNEMKRFLSKNYNIYCD
ncbi:MAG TPA: HEPN domain-containing protein [Spirochaetales bacterium]|nr:HEPN domain-containing protein [Spirochaetales bacterium]